MSTIPKIVLARLKGDSAVAKHPDADVLTAFAEKALTARERAGVFEHLARCADCRDVVAMALPPVEDVATVVVEDRSSRLAWPLLRWGFAALGVLLIGWFGVRLMQQSHSSDTVAKVAEPRIAEIKNSTPATNPAPMPTTPAKAEDSDRTAKTSGEATSAPNALSKMAEPVAQPDTTSAVVNHQPPSALVGGALTASVPGGPHASLQQQQRQAPTAGAAGLNAGKQAVPSAPSGAATETVAVSGAAPQVEAQDSDAAKSDSLNEVATLRDQPSPVQSEEKMVRAKPPQVADAIASSQPADGTRLKAQSSPVANVPVNGRAFTQMVATTSVAVAKWNIGAGGSLQRSFDQGGTWHDVDVLAGAASSESASYGAFAGTASTAEILRSKERDVEKKVAAGKSSPPVFRAVTANGADVWAGGLHGILYHSSDGGSHWSRVTPFAAGIALTGDIVAVEFPDSQHGRLTTSFAEVWTTNDAGQSWQKQ